MLPRRWSRPVLPAGASTRDAFMAHLRALVRMVEANVPGAAAARDPEYLHQLRAGLRRLRSTLRAFRPLLRRRKYAACDRALRDILRALGPARDWDVFLGAHGDSRLAPAARRKRREAQRAVRAVLRPAPLGRILRGLLAWEDAAPWRTHAEPDQAAAKFAPRALQTLRQSLRKAAQGIDWSDAARRHKVRIRAKRLRYGCECLSAACGERAVWPYLKRLRKLQRILGELNDLVVQRALLGELAREAGLRPAASALSELLAARERDLARKVAPYWRKLDPA